MRITTVELIQLYECCKNLKKSNCIVIGDELIGIDSCAIVVKTSLSWLYNNLELLQFLDGKIITSRNLSAFIKVITTEEYFDIDNYYTIGNIYGTFSFIVDMKTYRLVKANNTYVKTLMFPLQQDVTQELMHLQQMKKDDGYIRINISNHIMTMFPGLLPILKSDTVYLSILDGTNNYIAKFSIKKKKNVIVDVYISYLYI